MSDAANKVQNGWTPTSNLTHAGKGRQKGVVNKVTRELRTMVLEALEGAGGVDYLIARAEDQPAAFLSLVGKVLPLQVNAHSTVTFERIERAVVQAERQLAQPVSDAIHTVQ